MRNRWTNAVMCMGMLAILVAMSPAASALITDTSDLPPDGVYLSSLDLSLFLPVPPD